MTIDRLREALSAIGPPPDARELSEMLWLACHISPAEQQAQSHSPAAPGVIEQPAEPSAPGPPPPPTVPTPPAPLTRVHPRLGPTDAPVGEASEVLVPTAPMLADPLGVQRALRPLKRRVPSRHRFVLDEDATAARIADTRQWTPVLVPAAERWLTLSLVIDTGPTMRLWQPLARELAEVLLRQGAFQDVHLSHLDTTGRISSTPGAPLQDPGTLLDASGRHAVLVLSDCSGPHWWDGRAPQAVRRWARTGPTAILQPLAERLWRRTAAPAVPGLAALPRPAAPNTDLRFTPYDGPVGPGLSVPVLEVAPRWFGTWARLVSASGPQPTAVATFPARPSGTAPLRRERELPIAERVRRFLTTASPDAAELAAHVAVSVPSLPVMRLIQHRILGGSGPSQLAEVLLSGLLRPVGGVRYEFVPGAREALLDTLPRPEALHTRRVLEAVSAEIERRAGTSADRFRALLPTDGGPITLTADTDHFALLTPQTRSHLTPDPTPTAPDLLPLFGAPVEELIGENWYHGPPRPIPIGVDDNGETVWIDILGGGGEAPTGTIVGSVSGCHEMLQTLILGLAVSHSPNRVAFALFNCAEFHESDSHVGLDGLPHTIVRDPLGLQSDSGTISQLSNELWRRATTLRDAGVRTWGDYQAAIAGGRQLTPLPALVIILGMDSRSPEMGLGLKDRITQLSSEASSQGITFIFYLKETPTGIERHDPLSGWQVDCADPTGGGHATLRVQQRATRFRPVRVSSEAADRLLLQLSDRERPSVIPELVPATSWNVDVLMLNGGGNSGMFEGNWARPVSTPRHPAIGDDRVGNVITLDPLDISAEISHGLIAGEVETRQRIVRAVTLAAAASYSPSDLNLAFAGLGEHPLGEPLDLPHVIYSEEELLGRPEKLQEFIEYISNPRVSVQPRLLLVADISLTFPSSRREVGEMLLSLAQRGRSRGIQLILTSSMVENTTMWNRVLPLLDWRIAASGLAPAELRRVTGQASLPFPDGRTAYLVAGGRPPQRFSVAYAPPREVVDDFIDRMRNRLNDDALVQRFNALTGARPPLSPDERPRHLIFQGSDRSRMVSAARLYGRILRRSGVLSNGEVHQVPRLDGARHPVGGPVNNWLELFGECRGGVLFMHLSDLHHLNPRLESSFGRGFVRMMDLHEDDPMVILGVETGELDDLRRTNPFLTDRFLAIGDFDDPPSPDSSADIHGTDLPFSVHVSQLPAVTGARIPIGIESGTLEPVFVDFDTDPHLLVTGPFGSGRANLLHLLIQGITMRTGRAVHVLDSHEALRSLTEAFGLPEPVGPDVTYTNSGQVFAETLARVLRDPEDIDVYLVVIDRDVDDATTSTLLRGVAMSLGSRVHLVLGRLLTFPGHPQDPLVSTLHEVGAPAVLLGYSDGEEKRLYQAVSPAASPSIGRGVLVRGGRQRYIQVAHMEPGT